MKTLPYHDDQESRRRSLQRRVLWGTVALGAFLWGLLDGWDLPVSVFLEALIGMLLMIGVAVVMGALLGGLLTWLRHRRD